MSVKDGKMSVKKEKSVKKYRSRVGTILLLLLAFALSGCGRHSTIEVITEEKVYPEPDEVIGNLEAAGFEVESFGMFEELELETTRIKAVKGKEYLDICYHVPSEKDLDAIIEYYTDNYKQYNLVSNADIVFCYSGESVKTDAGLQ